MPTTSAAKANIVLLVISNDSLRNSPIDSEFAASGPIRRKPVWCNEENHSTFGIHSPLIGTD